MLKLPAAIQEELVGTNFSTLRRIYAEVTVEDMRAALIATDNCDQQPRLHEERPLRREDRNGRNNFSKWSQ